VIIDPNLTSRLMEQDPQLVLPSIVVEQMPSWLQVIFFGSLLSVIMSTASGTLLAPSVIFSNNILKNGIENAKKLANFRTVNEVIKFLEKSDKRPICRPLK